MIDQASPSAKMCFQGSYVAREHKVCSPLVPRKGNQEYGTASARSFLLQQAAGQHCLVENASQLRLQESAPMGRAWSKSGVQKGSSLCAQTFGAEIRRPARCGFCNSRSSQGPSHRGLPRPCSGRRPVPLQIKGSHPSGQGQAAHRACPLQPQRDNCQASDLLRRSVHAQVGRQAPRLYAQHVESAFFHVPIHPKYRKFFSSHSTTGKGMKPLRSSSLLWRCRSLSRTSLSSCSQEVTLSVQDQTSRHRCPRLNRLCTCANIIINSSSSPMRRCRSGGPPRPGFGRASGHGMSG